MNAKNVNTDGTYTQMYWGFAEYEILLYELL